MILVPSPGNLFVLDGPPVVGGGAVSITAPTAYWPLTEASNTTRNDNTASPTNLTDVNANTTQVAGLITNAAQASANTSFLRNNALGTKMLAGSGIWTWLAWVNIPSAWSTIVRCVTHGDNSTNGVTISVNLTPKLLVNNLGTTGSYTSTTSITKGAWNMLAVKYTGTGFALSVNGEAWETQTNDSAITAPTLLTMLGTGTDSITTTKHCECAWWKAYNVTNAELTTLYNSGNGRHFDGSAWH